MTVVYVDIKIQLWIQPYKKILPAHLFVFDKHLWVCLSAIETTSIMHQTYISLHETHVIC